MAKLSFLFRILIMILVVSTSVFAYTSVLANRIEGRVYGPNKSPVPNADIELMNDVNAILAHSITDSGGKFSFFGVSKGKFIIKASAYRLNLMEKYEDVEINPPRPGGSDTAFVDIYLSYDKHAQAAVTLTSPDAIFVQEIPSNAKDLYEKGLGQLEKKPEQAFANFEEAIKIFPTYFDALHVLGREYIMRKDYQKGYPYLLKAIDINPRSSSSYYSLGYAFLQLNELPAALEAAKAAVTINQSVADSQLLYGTVLRLSKNYAESEKTLLKAKSLTKTPVFEISKQLALVYNRLNRNQDAANELENFLKASPNSPDKKEIEDMIKKLRNSK